MSVVDLVSEAQKSHSVIQLFIPAIVVNTVLGDTPSPPSLPSFPLKEGEKKNGKRKLSRDLPLKAENGQRVALFFHELCSTGRT